MAEDELAALGPATLGSPGLLGKVRHAVTDGKRVVETNRLLSPLIYLYKDVFDAIDRLRAHESDEDAFTRKRVALLEDAHVRAAPLLAEMVGKLGCTFLKLAQYGASQGAPLFPDAWATALAFAYEAVPPRPFYTVRNAVIKTLGNLEEFESIAAEPLATASVAQVHAAVLVDARCGRNYTGFKRVAIKVLHGDARDKYPADARNARRLLLRLLSVIDSKIGGTMIATIDWHDAQSPFELDLRYEQKHMFEARELFDKRGFEDVVVPTPVPSLCGDRVLVAELLSGVTLAERDLGAFTAGDGRAAADEISFERVAPAPFLAPLLRCSDAVGATLFLDGFAHADPHPGNVMLMESNEIGLIDWGFAVRLSKDDVARVARLVLLLSTRSARLVNFGLGVEENRRAFDFTAEKRADEPDFLAAFAYTVCDTTAEGVLDLGGDAYVAGPDEGDFNSSVSRSYVPKKASTLRDPFGEMITWSKDEPK